VILNKRAQKLSLWLVFFAILSASLVPTISRLVFEKDIPMPGMVQSAKISESALPDCHSVSDSDGGAPSGHCLFCFIPGCPFELKSVALISLLFKVAERQLSFLYVLPVFSPAVWKSHRARAPPVFL